MVDKKGGNQISIRVHLINAIAWAGVMLVVSNPLPEFDQKIGSIILAGFF